MVVFLKCLFLISPSFAIIFILSLLFINTFLTQYSFALKRQTVDVVTVIALN